MLLMSKREREREREHLNQNLLICPQCNKQLTTITNYGNLYQSYKQIAEYLAEKGKIKIDKSKKYCSDNCLVESSGMNQILLNFSSQDHEDFVEWKRGRGNGHVNEQEVDNLKKQITSLESSQNPENTQQNENVKL